MMQIINHIKVRLGQSKTFISKMDNEFFTFPDALTVFDGYSGKKQWQAIKENKFVALWTPKKILNFCIVPAVVV